MKKILKASIFLLEEILIVIHACVSAAIAES